MKTQIGICFRKAKSDRSIPLIKNYIRVEYSPFLTISGVRRTTHVPQNTYSRVVAGKTMFTRIVRADAASATLQIRLTGNDFPRQSRGHQQGNDGSDVAGKSRARSVDTKEW